MPKVPYSRCRRVVTQGGRFNRRTFTPEWIGDVEAGI